MKKYILALCLVLISVSSFAALTVDQQAVVTATDTMIADMTTTAWSFVLAVLGALVGIKVFKKFFRAST